MGRAIHLGILAMVIAAVPPTALSQARVADTTASGGKYQYFVVQYTTGYGWDQQKKPGDQMFFKDHSALMQKLRKEGTTLIGGRYADIGLLIMKAVSLDDLKTTLAVDPSVEHGTMKFEVHPLSIFFGGCIGQ